MIAALSMDSMDTLAAILIAVACAGWLVRRAMRTFSARRAAGCGCANESACGPKGPAFADLKAAAARAVKRVNRTGGDGR